MSAEIQKRFGAGPWLPWATSHSLASAIEHVKDHCMAPGYSFRVLDPEGLEVFRWEFPSITSA